MSCQLSLLAFIMSVNATISRAVHGSSGNSLKDEIEPENTLARRPSDGLCDQ